MKLSKFQMLSAIFITLCLLFLMIQMKQTSFSHAKDTQMQFNPQKKYIMSYVYDDTLASNPDVYYTQSIKQTGNALNEISPPFLTLSENGTLNAMNIDRNFIKEMHDQSIKVVPYLSDQWNKNIAEAALKNKDKLALQIAKAITKYDLDGVNVDIEYVTDKDRQDYNSFVKLLRNALPKDKIVTVAVAANPYHWTDGWHGAYDDATLAKYSDYLMVMAYDEHSQGDKTSGPVASLSFVEKSIQYAISQKVPAKKIVLGIPFYGRIWKDDGSVKGLDVSLKIAENLIEKYHGNVIYDREQQTPKAVFTIKPTDEPTTLKKWDQKLTPGKYTLWYENEESIKAKLGLVQKYNLKGTGIWSLGQETAHTWDYYEKSLNTPDK